MLKHTDVFEQATVDQDLFMKMFAQVCTRNFDLDYGRVAMIPMADNYNHHNNEIQFGLVNKPEHL